MTGWPSSGHREPAAPADLVPRRLLTVCARRQMRGRVYPAPAAPLGLIQGSGGAGAAYGPPRYLDSQPAGQLSLQVRYSAQPGYQPAPYRHQAPPALPVSTRAAAEPRTYLVYHTPCAPTVPHCEARSLAGTEMF